MPRIGIMNVVPHYYLGGGGAYLRDMLWSHSLDGGLNSQPPKYLW